MTRADAWILFAAGAIARDSVSDSKYTATWCADQLLAEFDKRFEPVPYGDGQAPFGTAPDTFQTIGADSK